ncbi:MAG: hypothetical protein Athens101428_448 [Candidatus Berkelbacteria bacterium Athens1014_28]|uniref:Methyltransferase domain-containing protein n=1 Tax=Candidatus Berkelbacteria bacterium Athens1014_28 TaxID=2017145 RepID=A0A554LMG0_9BACT|nr:MAG: hypothetical protein Athens101428_448 [Candidatus Berkelbacteria bacterium Athens1014_28]
MNSETIKPNRTELPRDYLDYSDYSVTLEDTVVVDEHQKKYKELMLEAERRRKISQISFWNLLVENVAPSGFKMPEDGQVTILDLACGKCKEGEVLHAFFGGISLDDVDRGVRTDGVEIMGVDLDRNAILDAKMEYMYGRLDPLFEKDPIPFPNIDFIVGDATDLSKITNIPETADVVIIRNQQLIGSDNQEVPLKQWQDNWRMIFEQAFNKVDKEGIVIITSTSQNEHNTLIKLLEAMGEKVVIEAKNKFAGVLKGQSDIPEIRDGEYLDDNYVVVARSR